MRPNTHLISVIPVVVGLDVCTVQLEGEPIGATMGRAIRPETMFPLSLCFVPLRKGDRPKVSDEKSYTLHKSFLMELPRVRPDDDMGLARMEACAVCSRAFPAAQVSYLPCGHAFHSHCVFRWFNDGKSSCPSCGARVPADLEEECNDDDIFL
ncbi:E3 ubiquitin-protein ligase ring1-like [Phtheirospermum japonicum]|uniref:E3 ubiquitin-protein ligase ring1-like n=1 Tax=Phtheirospermum japonicum TaxID=374723 RepID=A0A830CNJ9_9LAMI|nr:E3 ubiquitin-protein ligase ring1-like [Phtheirospermum japonicum]GFP97434.1 E3 ubiquitin-protein ligase ring1-like [Phtheirospermum japonicum]